MEKEEITEFDYTDVYNRDILPMIKDIKKICKVKGIPFVFSIAIKSDTKKTKYVHEANLTGSNGIHLKNDRFEQYLAALCSIDLVPRTSFNKHYEADASIEELDEDAMNYIAETSAPEIIDMDD